MPLAPGAPKAPSRFRSTIMRQRDLDFGEHPFRFIEGGDTVDSVMWPTLAFNEDAQELQPTWRSVRLPLDDKHTLLDKLSAKEKALRQAMAAQTGQKAEPVIERRRSNLYAAFSVGDAEHKNKPTPILFSISSYGVAQDIRKFHTATAKADPAFLEYGPMQFYNIWIEKYRQESSKGTDRRTDAQRTRYRAMVKRNDWAENCPVEWRDGLPEGYDWVGEGVFTEAEWGAIVDSDIDLIAHTAPHTEEEIEAMLSQFPVNFNYITRDDRELFEAPLRKELTEIVKQLGLPQASEASHTFLPASKSNGEGEPPDEPQAGVAEVILEGDTIWCDEDGEDVHYTVSSHTGGVVTVVDKQGAEYDLDTPECHLVPTESTKKVPKKAKKAKKIALPVIAVGSTVWCDEDGEDTTYEVAALNGTEAEVTDGESIYEVPLGELHLITDSDVAAKRAQDWGGDVADELPDF